MHTVGVQGGRTSLFEVHTVGVQRRRTCPFFLQTGRRGEVDLCLVLPTIMHHKRERERERKKKSIEQITMTNISQPIVASRYLVLPPMAR